MDFFQKNGMALVAAERSRQEFDRAMATAFRRFVRSLHRLFQR